MCCLLAHVVSWNCTIDAQISIFNGMLRLKAILADRPSCKKKVWHIGIQNFMTMLMTIMYHNQKAGWWLFLTNCNGCFSIVGLICKWQASDGVGVQGPRGLSGPWWWLASELILVPKSNFLAIVCWIWSNFGVTSSQFAAMPLHNILFFSLSLLCCQNVRIRHALSPALVSFIPWKFQVVPGLISPLTSSLFSTHLKSTTVTLTSARKTADLLVEHHFRQKTTVYPAGLGSLLFHP